MRLTELYEKIMKDRVGATNTNGEAKSPSRNVKSPANKSPNNNNNVNSQHQHQTTNASSGSASRDKPSAPPMKAKGHLTAKETAAAAAKKKAKRPLRSKVL
jgi:hypothetical protein